MEVDRILIVAIVVRQVGRYRAEYWDDSDLPNAAPLLSAPLLSALPCMPVSDPESTNDDVLDVLRGRERSRWLSSPMP